MTVYHAPIRLHTKHSASKAKIVTDRYWANRDPYAFYPPDDTIIVEVVAPNICDAARLLQQCVLGDDPRPIQNTLQLGRAVHHRVQKCGRPLYVSISHKEGMLTLELKPTQSA